MPARRQPELRDMSTRAGCVQLRSVRLTADGGVFMPWIGPCGMTDDVRAQLTSLAGVHVGEGVAGSPGECARAAARRRAQEANQRLAQLPRELRVAVHATRQPDSTYLIDAVYGVAPAAKAATPAASEAA